MKIQRTVSSKQQLYGRAIVHHYDKYGKLKKTIETPLDSFAPVMWQQQRSSFAGQGNTSFNLMFGGTRSIHGAGSMQAVGNAGANIGINVGTSDAPMTIDTYTFPNVVNHGSGAGELNRGATTSSWNATTATVTFFRGFTNDSGGTVTIREVAIGNGNSSTDSNPWLLARDVLPEAVSILDEESVTVTYQMFFTVGTRSLHGWLHMFASTINDQVMYRTDGSTYTLSWRTSPDSGWSAGTAGSGAATGLRLGRGDAAFDITNLDLTDRIGIGDGPGEVFHGVQSLSGVSLDTENNEMEFSMVREFHNNSGSPIEVKEAGFFMPGQSFGLVMLDRAVLPEPFTILHGQIISVRWIYKYAI